MSPSINPADGPQPQGPELPVKLPEEQTDRDFDEEHEPLQNDDGIAPSSTGTRRPRTATNTAEIDTALSHPGSVRINVKGAFIVDQEGATPPSPSINGENGAGINSVGNGNGRASPSNHETKDIRLPNHTAVVSHIAVDVCQLTIFLFYFLRLHFPSLQLWGTN